MSDLRVARAVVDTTVVDAHVSNFSVCSPLEPQSPNIQHEDQVLRSPAVQQCVVSGSSSVYIVLTRGRAIPWSLC